MTSRRLQNKNEDIQVVPGSRLASAELLSHHLCAASILLPHSAEMTCSWANFPGRHKLQTDRTVSFSLMPNGLSIGDTCEIVQPLSHVLDAVS